MILRHNARHPDDPTPLPQWITESPDNYATLKRPLPESKTDRIYIYDRDYRCDPWDEPTIYDSNKLSTPIDAENIICIEDKTIWAHQERRKRENVDPPVTPPKTAPVTACDGRRRRNPGMSPKTA